MGKIIGIGNSLVDILARVGNDESLAAMNLPKGSMQLVDSVGLGLISKWMRRMECSRATGGSAANTMKALARLGAFAGFIGKIASDEFGLFFASELENSGVHASLIRKSSGSTGIASTFISPDGQRTFATYLGASGELSDKDITTEALQGYDILYVEGYLVQNHALIEHAMDMAKHLGMTVCLDLASYNIVESEREFFAGLLGRYVDIVFANEEESRAFTGRPPLEAAAELAKLCRIAVVKLGAAGSCVCDGGNVVTCPAVPINRIVDTTGAGDYFAAGFLYGYTRQRALPECLSIGGSLAAAVIQVIGTTLHRADWSKINAQFCKEK